MKRSGRSSIVQASRLADGQRKITSITEVLEVSEDKVMTNEVFTFRRSGIDDAGKLLGDHVYVQESHLMERFYQAGVLPRP